MPTALFIGVRIRGERQGTVLPDLVGDPALHEGVVPEVAVDRLVVDVITHRLHRFLLSYSEAFAAAARAVQGRHLTAVRD